MKTGFDQAIKDARDPDHRNFSHTLARRIRAEKRMCVALVNACIDRGFSVSVFDGEEWTVKRSTDRERILMALFSTDQDLLKIHDAAGQSAGWFELVYGNDGHDVVSDFTANEVCSNIWDDVLRPLSDKLEAILS